MRFLVDECTGPEPSQRGCVIATMKYSRYLKRQEEWMMKI